MIERLADCDDEVAELFIMEEEIDVETLQAAIRRQTIAGKFVPVFMGSAFKNKGVQPLLDGVLEYLPHPAEVTHHERVRLGQVDDLLHRWRTLR